MPILRITNPKELRAQITLQRRAGKTIGLVPTMGALHDGHIHLASTALAQSDVVVSSIFVNPKQFAPHEDFGRYPRTPDEDVQKLEAAGVHVAYLPEPDAMYPPEFFTSVHVGTISEPLEGEFRPAFFDGVATVVAKLLLQVQPDKAFFGEKDYQQLQVVKRMAADLNLPVEIVGVGTVRDQNGLALSSRNAYLSAEQYKIACELNRILAGMGELARQGLEPEKIDELGHHSLLEAGFGKVDYCTVRDAQTLQAPQEGRPQRVLAAAWLGTTRLIDNMAV